MSEQEEEEEEEQQKQLQQQPHPRAAQGTSSVPVNVEEEFPRCMRFYFAAFTRDCLQETFCFLSVYK